VQLAGIFLYPVKSLRGLEVAEAAVDALGLAGDRRFMIVDPAGQFLTQRSLPRLARIATALDADELTLRAEGAGEVRVRRAPDPAAALRPVSIWKDPGLQAEDCGEEPARWLGEFLGTPCRLVRIGPAFARPIPGTKLAGLPAGRQVGFADAYPFLVLGESTLADLNARLAAQGGPALPMDRFRPNLVVRGSAAYAEDGWERFRLGGVVFRGGEPCARCVITTTDQATGERGPEPLRTLAGYRRDPREPAKVNFGRNFLHETSPAVLRTGEPLELLTPSR
jgi:uncharacterized protein YcbX